MSTVIGSGCTLSGRAQSKIADMRRIVITAPRSTAYVDLTRHWMRFAVADRTTARFETAPPIAPLGPHVTCRRNNESASIAAMALDRGEPAAVDPAIRLGVCACVPKPQLIALRGLARRAQGATADPGTQLRALVQQGADSPRMLHLDALLTQQ
ncbi:hypothetical protein ACIA5H_23650 [Nocardia sp. NPDC051900]|uniref:hypothetical protein n=1 Tax=Nocardia sp. NPDC051900 TaxID=3364326 RepID=UPI00379C6C65